MSRILGHPETCQCVGCEAIAACTAQAARIAELEAENRLLRARPMHKWPDFRDGIPSDEE